MSTRNSKLFISGLGPGVQQKDIVDLFSRHGRVLACSLKNGYAFVEFSHADDADDAIRGLDGHIYHGKKLLVQLAVQKGKAPSPSRDMSRNRIYVGGLTEGINMRELEEVFSEVGHVVRTVDKKSFAFLEYESPSHAEKAIKRFHHTDFAGRRLTVNFATIPFHHSRTPGPHHSPRRGRSRSASRSLSRGRKRMRYSSLSRSRSRSTSRSPNRGYSRSRSRSRDRSAWDRGRDRGRDRHRGRGRSRDYSPYSRSWSRSTSRSTSRSDSSRSRSRSRSVSKSPISSQSSSSPPLNSPPARVSNHSAVNGHAPKDSPHPPTSVPEVLPVNSQNPSTPTTTLPIITPSSSSEAQPLFSESHTGKPDDSQRTPTTTTSIVSPTISSTSASPTPTSPSSPAQQDMIMADIKTEQSSTDVSQASSPQQPPRWEPPTSNATNKHPSSLLGHYTPNLSALLPTPSIPPAYPIAHIPMPLPTTIPLTTPSTISTYHSISSSSTSTTTQSTTSAILYSPTSSSELEQEEGLANFDTEKEKEQEKDDEKEKEKDQQQKDKEQQQKEKELQLKEKEQQKEKDKEKDKEKEKDKDMDVKERDSRDYRDRDREKERDRDAYRDRDYRDRERERDKEKEKEKERDYSRRRYSERPAYTSSHHGTSTQDSRKPERDAAHQSTDAEDAQKEGDTPRANGLPSGSGPANSSTDPPTSMSTTVSTQSNKDALDQVLVNLFKTRDSMLKGIDGVFGELQRRNQLFTQLISREEGRNKEIDGLRAELVNVKKDLVAKQDMGWRRLESELERRLGLLERKMASKPPEEDSAVKGGKALMSQDSFITALTNSLAPVCASVETLYKMIGEARNEQQGLKNEMRLVLDALRADVHGSREAVLVKVDVSLGDLRAPLGQLAASEAQSARLIDGVRAQVVTLQQQVANVAQAQQTQQAQAPQEPAPSFAGAFGKKMFPIEALTSKIFSIDQKIETLEGNLTKQFLELKNEVLTQQAIKGMMTEDKKNAARATRKKGSGSAV